MSLRAIARGLTIVGVLLAASGCASIIKGSDQNLSFKSEPPAAKVVVTDLNTNKDVHTANTPFTVSLKRGAGYFKSAKYRAVFEMPGYDKQEVVIEGKPGGWYAGGNLLFGHLGWVYVDPATGAMWTLEPNDVSVTLKRRTALLERGEGLVLALRSDIPSALVPYVKPLWRQAP